MKREADLLLEDFAGLLAPAPGSEAPRHESSVIHPLQTQTQTQTQAAERPVVHTLILTGGGFRLPYFRTQLRDHLVGKFSALNRRAGRGDVHLVCPTYPEELNAVGAAASLWTDGDEGEAE